MATLCKVKTCEAAPYCRDWCKKHYSRWWKYGSPTVQKKLKHGLAKTPEWHVWTRMLRRCDKEYDISYANYGGRGISVCPEWYEFGNFIADMGTRPSKKHSIERLDNNGNYSPENCKWALKDEQANNTRINRYITIDGATKTLSQWSKATGVNRRTIAARIDIQKLSPREAVGG